MDHAILSRERTTEVSSSADKHRPEFADIAGNSLWHSRAVDKTRKSFGKCKTGGDSFAAGATNVNR
jgi:hypothetical protein